MPLVPQPAPRAHWDRPHARAILVALCLSVLVHGATYFGLNLPGAFFPFWGLHVAAIAAFGAMVVSTRRSHKAGAGWTLPHWPAWAYLLVAATYFYGMINFVLFFTRIQGGSPEERDGAFVLVDHGRIIRALTADEYRWLQVYIVRGFSGHWVFFLAIPAMYFLFRQDTRDSLSAKSAA
jgi:hypothetical protein